MSIEAILILATVNALSNLVNGSFQRRQNRELDVLRRDNENKRQRDEKIFRAEQKLVEQRFASAQMTKDHEFAIENELRKQHYTARQRHDALIYREGHWIDDVCPGLTLPLALFDITFPQQQSQSVFHFNPMQFLFHSFEEQLSSLNYPVAAIASREGFIADAHAMQFSGRELHNHPSVIVYGTEAGSSFYIRAVCCNLFGINYPTTLSRTITLARFSYRAMHELSTGGNEIHDYFDQVEYLVDLLANIPLHAIFDHHYAHSGNCIVAPSAELVLAEKATRLKANNVWSDKIADLVAEHSRKVKAHQRQRLLSMTNDQLGPIPRSL